MTEDISDRLNRLSETILDNESLTDQLDDDSAKVLFDWGFAALSTVVAATDGMDKIQAESRMESTMRGLSRLMRLVNFNFSEPTEIDADTLDQIIDQVKFIYEERYQTPDAAQRAQFLRAMNATKHSSQGMILMLRQWIENSVILDGKKPTLIEE